ncbi:Inner membrane transport permease ybhS [Fibrella aestuarina BUZ 2]|uniref:Inner membrane transport permease ybhS n=1 Tax=Fibrella aestuarina BUZ 2 TaxID=1166018 RepID=I0KG50_9BACT|nr:ABC transporter permease [Fibrella aestuarina]CCH03103.1 Inner membrane transport permease ybhS [Fibrella aestuarina BUZ 2]
MKTFVKLLLREFRQFSRNSVAMAVFLGGPVVFGLLVGYTYTNATVTNLPIAVVDLNGTPLSGKVIDALADNPTVGIRKVFTDETAARRAFATGDYEAIVTIPQDFEGAIQQRRTPEIEVDLNMANILTANFVSRAVQTTLGTVNAGIEVEGLLKRGVPAVEARNQFQAFSINNTRYFNAAGNYGYYMLPGVTGGIVQQVFLLVLALAFSKEFDEHTFDQLTEQTNRSGVVLLTKTLPYWLMGAGVWAFVLGFLFPLFRLPAIGSLPALLTLVAAFTLALTGLGVLVSLLVPNQLRATEILMILATPAFIISGYSWPASQMPAFVQHLAQAIPLTHYLSAFRKLYFLNAPLSTITPELRTLFGYGIGTLALAWGALAWKMRPAKPAQPALA